MRLLWLICLWGCAPPSATVIDLAPDANRPVDAGQLGPFGAAHAHFKAPARVTDVVDYDVSWPAGADGQLNTKEGPYPTVIWVHGGFVRVEQYRWIATHLASRGYVVISADHTLDLAILQTENAQIAYTDAYQRSEQGTGILAGAMDGQAVVSGHSLGGAVATMLWAADPDIDGLMLIASWAPTGTDVEAQTGRPSLSVIGSEDQGGEATVDAYEKYDRFPDPSWFGVVDGMNHYDWVDDASKGELQSDGEHTRPQPETRQNAMRVVDTWLDATVKGDAAAVQVLSARQFDGVGAKP